MQYVLGIDQSYKRTGITVLNDGEIVEMLSVDYVGCKTNSDKRRYLKSQLEYIINVHEIKQPLVICERIRLRSQGFINEDYIKATGALISVIIDFFNELDVPVFSVDTRAWKSAIVGTSKPLDNKYGIDPNKYPTILYLKNLGHLSRIVYKYKGRGRKGVISVKIDGQKVPCKINDDLADSFCIAQYGFLPKNKQKLKQETF